MPWKNNDYPPSMKNLEPRVRKKAVEIANALLEEGYDEGRSIAIATAKAKEWDDDHPKEGRGSGKSADKETDSGSNLHVVPEGEGWAVKEEGKKSAKLNTSTKTEAVDKAKKWAADANTTAVIHRKDGTVQTTHNFS